MRVYIGSYTVSPSILEQQQGNYYYRIIKAHHVVLFKSNKSLKRVDFLLILLNISIKI